MSCYQKLVSMNKIIFLIFLCLVTTICFSQGSVENYLLQDVGYISIPANMEIQSGNNKIVSGPYQKETDKKFGFEVFDRRIVFKQKVNNSDEKNEFSSYARVILNTTIGNAGDFEKLTTRLAETTADLAILSNQIRSQIEQSFIGTGVKLINWYGVTIVPVNGRTALNISYSRQLNDQPYVAVSIYQFNNNDRIHKLTFSYAEQDANTWRPLCSNILTSFTITNVR